MKFKLGVPQKPGTLHLSKSHRIKEAVIQIIFLTRKHETRLCKDAPHKKRRRSVGVYDSCFTACAAQNQICKLVKHLEGRASDGHNCHGCGTTNSIPLPSVI